MSDVGQIERKTQNRVIKLFADELGYEYLGDWQDRDTNSNIEDNQELFAKNLYDLLYGGDALMKRFNRFCDTLIRLEVDKWAVATFFLFIIFPNQYMLIRSTPTIKASKMCGIDIKYNTKTNYETFDSVNQFSNFLKVKLSQLKPRDMIDIQSFMWCIRLFKI